MTEPGRILFCRGGALGDFLVTLPSIMAVRQRFSNADVELLAHPAYGGLALELGLIQGFRSLEAGPLAAFFSESGFEPAQNWRQWFGGFDLVVSWLSDRDQIFQRNVRSCGAGEFLQGLTRAEESGRAASEQFGWVVADRFAVSVPLVADLSPHLQVQRVSHPTLAVHLGSGSPRKNWPADRWSKLLSVIHMKFPDLHVVIFSGEAEADWIFGFVRGLRISPSQLLHVHDLPLGRAVGRLQSAIGFMGHDSGFAHLSAACGIPSLLLFGPSDPTIWAPPAPHSRVIKAPADLSALSLEHVVSELTTILPQWLKNANQPLR